MPLHTTCGKTKTVQTSPQIGRLKLSTKTDLSLYPQSLAMSLAQDPGGTNVCVMRGQHMKWYAEVVRSLGDGLLRVEMIAAGGWEGGQQKHYYGLHRVLSVGLILGERIGWRDVSMNLSKHK